MWGCSWFGVGTICKMPLARAGVLTNVKQRTSTFVCELVDDHQSVNTCSSSYYSTSGYLDANSLSAAELVCTAWLRVISEGMLWKKLIEGKVGKRIRCPPAVCNFICQTKQYLCKVSTLTTLTGKLWKRICAPLLQLRTFISHYIDMCRMISFPFD